MSAPRNKVFYALAFSALLGLSACSGGSGSHESGSGESGQVASSSPAPSSASASASPVEQQSPTARTSDQPDLSATPSATASPTRSPVVTTDESQPAPSGSVVTVPPTATPSPQASSHSTPAHAAGTPVCDYGQIHIAAQAANGAAGSRYIALTFTNAGSSSCLLSGWPDVNYVDASGKQIGATSSHASEWMSSGEVLSPGETANATLRETRANLYGDTCQPVTAAGYQVHIPGTDRSLTLAFPAEACSNSQVSQLSVGQVGANP